MDEIDAIGGRRFSEGTSADREIQRTLMELLNQLDGFDVLGMRKRAAMHTRPHTLEHSHLTHHTPTPHTLAWNCSTS
jgi:26S proteasome regulatory subunit T4